MSTTRSGSKDLDDSDNPYNYVPTEWVCILFLALFGISTSMSLGENPFHSESGRTHRNIAALHIAQAVRYRLWWLFPTAVVPGSIELIGWSGRLWSSRNPPLRTPFLMQYVYIRHSRAYIDDEGDRVATLIMAPTFLIASNFVVLGRIIKLLGPQYCRMTQKLCE